MAILTVCNWFLDENEVRKTLLPPLYWRFRPCTHSLHWVGAGNSKNQVPPITQKPLRVGCSRHKNQIPHWILHKKTMHFYFLQLRLILSHFPAFFSIFPPFLIIEVRHDELMVWILQYNDRWTTGCERVYMYVLNTRKAMVKTRKSHLERFFPNKCGKGSFPTFLENTSLNYSSLSSPTHTVSPHVTLYLMITY